MHALLIHNYPSYGIQVLFYFYGVLIIILEGASCYFVIVHFKFIYIIKRILVNRILVNRILVMK